MERFDGWRAEVPPHWPDLDIGGGMNRLWTIYAGTARTVFKDEVTTFFESEYFRIAQWHLGWPMRSLRAEIWSEIEIDQAGVMTFRFEGHPPPSVWHDGIDTDRGILRLPIRPVFPGIIVNSILYAVILGLLSTAPFATRRMLRRRRGQCAKCAYPVGTSPVCTECGAAVRCGGNT
jgi:hypothetical protein